MKQERNTQLIKYLVCIGVSSLIAFLVFWMKGFFVHSPSVNLQILADGFFVAGILVTLFGLMLFISSQGALIGIGFVLRTVVQAFVPMGRKNHQVYAKYRERKMNELKEMNFQCVLYTGLAFLLVGIVLTVIWSKKYYS